MTVSSLINAISGTPNLSLYVPFWPSASPLDYISKTPINTVVTGTVSFGQPRVAGDKLIAVNDTSLQLAGGAITLTGQVYQFTGTAAFAVEFIFKPSTVDANLRRVVSQEQFITSADVGWHVSYSSAGWAFVRADNGGTDTLLQIGTAPAVGRADHVMVYYDGLNSYLSVNGSFNLSTSSRAMPTAAANLPLTIGAPAYSISNASTFNGVGSLQHLAIYSNVPTWQVTTNGRARQHSRIHAGQEIRPDEASDTLFVVPNFISKATAPQGQIAYGPTRRTFDMNNEPSNYVITGDPFLQAAIRDSGRFTEWSPASWS